MLGKVRIEVRNNILKHLHVYQYSGEVFPQVQMFEKLGMYTCLNTL